MSQFIRDAVRTLTKSTRGSALIRHSNASFLAMVLVLLCVFPTFHIASATTVVPVPEQALIEDAIAIVSGSVILIESYWDAQQEKIFTHISLCVEETLKGEFDNRELILKQLGGQISGLHSWVYGSPEFTIGEKVLLFLSRNPDGSLRVAHLFQGKFSIFFDTNSGEEFAYRETPAGVQVLSSPSVSKGSGSKYEIQPRSYFIQLCRRTSRLNFRF